MKQDEKLKLIQDLNHDELIGLVLMDLFEGMDFYGIRNYHGPLEEGKDILFCHKDPIQSFEFRGAIVETSKITANLHGKSAAQAFYYQAEKALEEPFKDLVNNTSFFLSKCYIITPHAMDAFAKNSIAQKFKYHSNSIIFIDGIDLVQLLDIYTPDIFSGTLSSSNKYLRHLYTTNVLVKNLKLLRAHESRKVYDVYTGGKMVSFSPNITRSPTKLETYDTNELFQEYPVSFLYGDPGSGKSLMLQKFILDSILDMNGKLMQDLMVVPIYVRLYSLHNYELHSFDAFVGSILDSIKPLGYNASSPLNANKKYVFLFDGLDEISKEQIRRSFIQLLRYFLRSDRYRVVVTSRYYCESEVRKVLKAPNKSECANFSLLPFSNSDKKSFLRKWFLGNYQEADKLTNRIGKNKSLSFLSQVPLLLTLIAILQRENQTFSKGTHADLRKIDIYDNIVTLLLDTWEKDRKLSIQYDPDDKKYMLEELAFHCHFTNKREITHKEVMEVFAVACSNTRIPKRLAEDVLYEICERSNLLIKNENKNFEFYHLSFQEYFTASRLYRNNSEKEVLAHVRDTWWHNVLEMYSGLRRDISPMYRKMWRITKGSSTNLVLLSKCLREAKFTKHEYKKELFRNVLKEVETITNINDEWIQVLATLEEEFWANFDLVGKVLVDRPDVVFRILAAINSDKALKSLGEYKLHRIKAGNTNVKIAYIESLAQFESSECVPHLVSFYNSLKGSLDLSDLDVLRKIVELTKRHRKLNIIKADLKDRIEELESIYELLQKGAFIDKPRELLPKFSQLAKLSPKSFFKNMDQIVDNVADIEMWKEIAKHVMEMQIAEDRDELLRDQKYTLNNLVDNLKSQISFHESGQNRIKNIQREISRLINIQREMTTEKQWRDSESRRYKLENEIESIKKSSSFTDIVKLQGLKLEITDYLRRRAGHRKGDRRGKTRRT